MKVSRFASAVVFACVSLTPALSQTSAPAADTATSAGKTPTVTIINKSTTVAREAAAPDLVVTPDASRPPAEARGALPAPGTGAASTNVTAAAPEAAAPAVADPVPEAVAPPPEPTLAIDIDLTRQSMTVSEDGVQLHSWQISSAAYGYRTPTGTFQPTWMAKMWYSRQYDNAPMPHAIFFHKGVAIHATYATRSLGRPASHGCVRLAPRNAAKLFALVNRHGKERTQIVVRGHPNHSSSQIASYDRSGRARRGTVQRYMPSGAYGARAYAPPPGYYYGPVRQQRRYAAPRYQPRGLYNSYSSGYGF